MSSFVYKIWSNRGDKVYYGSSSSKRNPKDRYQQHVSKYKGGYALCSSKILFDEYGVENCLFEIIEHVEDVSQLRRRERFYIEHHDCVNKTRPSPTEDEIKERQKEYNKNRKTERKEYDASRYRKRNPARYIIIECDCGGSYVPGNKSRHEKTKKHIEFQNTQ